MLVDAVLYQRIQAEYDTWLINNAFARERWHLCGAHDRFRDQRLSRSQRNAVE